MESRRGSIILLISTLFFSVCTSSCDPEKKESISVESNSLQLIIENDLKLLGINSKTILEEMPSRTLVKIEVLNKDVFLDRYTNELIVNFLIFKNKDEFAKLKKPTVELRFNEFDDFYSLEVDKNLDSINLFFASKNFFNDVKYSLKNFNYEEIVVFESLINLIASESSIDAEPLNYWETMRYLSSCAENMSQEKIEYVHLFITMIQLIKHTNTNLSDSEYLKFTPLLNKYGIDVQVLDMTSNTKTYLVSCFQ